MARNQSRFTTTLRSEAPKSSPFDNGDARLKAPIVPSGKGFTLSGWGNNLTDLLNRGLNPLTLAGLDQKAKELGVKPEEVIRELIKRGGVIGDMTDKSDWVKDNSIFHALKLAYEKMKADGTSHNDRDDPNSKFNLENIMNKLATSSNEVSGLWDKDGNFWGSFTGKKDQVAQKYTPEMTLGGVHLHNHPIFDEREIGASFSNEDWKMYEKARPALAIVVAREGVYTLSGFRKDFPNYLIPYLSSTFGKQTNSNGFFYAKDDKGNYFKSKVPIRYGNQEGVVSTTKDEYYLNFAHDSYEKNKRLSESLGVTMTFTPRKGFEGVIDGKTPLPKVDDATWANMIKSNKKDFKQIKTKGFV